jgi:hypothetical protein
MGRHLSNHENKRLNPDHFEGIDPVIQCLKVVSTSSDRSGRDIGPTRDSERSRNYVQYDHIVNIREDLHKT